MLHNYNSVYFQYLVFMINFFKIMVIVTSYTHFQDIQVTIELGSSTIKLNHLTDHQSGNLHTPERKRNRIQYRTLDTFLVLLNNPPTLIATHIVTKKKIQNPIQ